ncbi:hypothetical protein KUCAC02_026490, partial [Chaenocephalus aceratus]
CCDTVRGVFAPTLLSPTMTQPQEASTAPPSHVPWLCRRSTLEMEGTHHLWLCPLSSGRIYRHVWQSLVSMSVCCSGAASPCRSITTWPNSNAF